MKSRVVYRLGFAVLGVSAAVNVVVAVRVFFAMQSPVSYNIRVIEPPVFTNVVASLPTLPPMPGVRTNESPQTLDVSLDLNTNRFEVASESYHYMRVDGQPRFRLNGRNYAVGDLTAYGKVERIYPERIYLDDGGFISNTRRVFDIVEFVPPSARSDPPLHVQSGDDPPNPS